MDGRDGRLMYEADLPVSVATMCLLRASQYSKIDGR